MSRILEIEFVHFAKCKSQTTSKNDLGKAVRLVRQTAQGPSALTPFQCSRGIDAYGVSGFGSAMPESKLSVAAFALHATPADSSVKSLRCLRDILAEI